MLILLLPISIIRINYLNTDPLLIISHQWSNTGIQTTNTSTFFAPSTKNADMQHH